MANLYDLKKFDLNLLVIFECIYQHLSISKAAETLYITPSAVSQSLQRLRTQLNDPLFIRSGRGITPTTTGVNLHHHLAENLNSLEQTINIMHNANLKKKMVVYTHNLSGPFHTMKLINLAHSVSDVEIEHFDSFWQESAEELLAYRKADIVLSTTPINSRAIICRQIALLESTLVCSDSHPRIGDSASLEDILQEKFTLLTPSEPGVKTYQAASSALFGERNIGFRSTSLIAIINVIAGTELLGILPENMFNYYSNLMKIKKIDIPFKLPTIPIYFMYNRSSLNNKSFSNFVEKVENSLA